MSFVDNSRQVKAMFAKAKRNTLLAFGEHMNDALANNTHRVTGLLANSYNYRLSDYQSGFGDGPTQNAKETLGPENYTSQPPTDTVRNGSALSYSEPYNNRFKVFEQTIDNEQRNLKGIAEAVYKKEFA